MKGQGLTWRSKLSADMAGEKRLLQPFQLGKAEYTSPPDAALEIIEG